MNKEMLFKAKRIDNGKWAEGLVTVMWGQYHIINLSDENTAYSIDPKTICRCTGKEYMDGTLAYEGDIFESQVSGDIMILRFGTYQAYCPVDKDCMDSVGFYAECNGLPDMPIGDLKDYALQKGNIFDNPKLFKRTKRR